MDLVILEVDGSLANPYVAGAVALWSVLLGTLAVVVVRQFAGPGRYRFVWGLLFAVALLDTKSAQLLIGNVLYAMVTEGTVRVGFWGGPPVWIGPVVAGCAGVVTWAIGSVMRRRRRL
jgi:hypothetical protein